MRIALTLAVLLFCGVITCNAQRTVKDSLQYYNSRLTRLYNRVWDSLKLDDSARYYRQQIKRAHERSKRYTAVSIFGGLEGADYSAFNTAIAKDGFPAISGPSVQFGAGYSNQGYNGWMLDLNFLVADFGRTVNNGDASISTGSLETLNIQLGYAVINPPRFTIYPYVGITARFSTLNYDTPDTANSGFNSIASLVQNDRSVHGTSANLGYQAGLGADWIVYYNEKTRGGIILFGKIGTDHTFNDVTYLISNVTYDPGIHYGDWVAQVGVKFFTRL